MSSWSSIVKRGLPDPVPMVAPTPVPKKPMLPCVDCLKPAQMCIGCGNRPALDIHDRKCGICFCLYTPSDSMCAGYVRDSRDSGNGVVPARCKSCLTTRPWSSFVRVKEVGFHYEPACFCHPLSPTNRIHIPHYEAVPVPPTMLDVVNGRRVTGMEFIAAVAIYNKENGIVTQSTPGAIDAGELERQILADAEEARRSKIRMQQAQRIMGTPADSDAISESGFTDCPCFDKEECEHSLQYFAEMRSARRAWRNAQANSVRYM